MADLISTLAPHRVIGIDTSIFIYHLEASSKYVQATTAALRHLVSGASRGVTSTVTIMEVMVQPLQMGRPEVADAYSVLLANFPNLTITSVDGPRAQLAAVLRAKYRLRPADALQIGSCLQSGATAFLTNDKSLRRVSEITVLVLDDVLETDSLLSDE